jgi:DNA invertase Pin-like site-specific DNA recombinase
VDPYDEVGFTYTALRHPGDYARVSTENQHLDAQLEQLHQAGCNKIYKEKASGVKVDRPQLATMLDYVREGDTVVAYKLVRMWKH